MLELRSEEIAGLKKRLGEFDQENKSLKNLVRGLEECQKEDEDVRLENENLRA